MAEEVQSGYIPGRALSQDAYGNSFVDFYKDYIGSTGIKSTVPVDEEDDEDKDKYVAPNITNVGGGDDDGGQQLNLLSATFSNNNLSGGQTYYDSKVSSVDLQSMDLSAKSWDDYKKGQGRADKSDFNRNASITGGGLALAGMSGAMLGGALLGKKEPTPWGSENLGAGMFNAIGNMAASAKYEALKEIQTLAATEDYDFTDIDGTTYTKGDGGYAINVDGTVLVRSPGSSQYIGTLPSGMSNQQVLSLEAIQKGKLPPRAGTYFNRGIGNEEGFGVSGLGGYTSTGAFIDANGVTAAYGSMKALNALAEKDFGGSVKKAEQWLSEVRKDRSIFDFSPHMSIKEAQAIKDRINGTSSGDNITTTTTKTDGFKEAGGPPTSYTPPVQVDSFGDNRFSPTNITQVDSFGDNRFTPPATFTAYDIDTRFSPSIDDTEFAGVTSGRAKEALRDAADRSARMQERERQDAQASGSNTMGSGTENNESDGVGSSGNLGGASGVGDFTGPGSISGIDGVEQAAIEQAADSSGGGSNDKIVCTAMNNSYGFGSFRQTIWLKHSRNLDPAYQTGYHRLFRPLIKYAYTEDSLPNRIVKKWLEGVAKRRTADIWLQQRGNKRHLGGRIERAILEPICYIVGKL